MDGIVWSMVLGPLRSSDFHSKRRLPRRLFPAPAQRFAAPGWAGAGRLSGHEDDMKLNILVVKRLVLRKGLLAPGCGPNGFGVYVPSSRGFGGLSLIELHPYPHAKPRIFLMREQNLHGTSTIWTWNQLFGLGPVSESEEFKLPQFPWKTNPDTPWDCHICLHWGGARGVNVGIYGSPRQVVSGKGEPFSSVHV